MDAHAFDFGTLRAGAVKGSHGDENAIPFADQKFSLVVEIGFFDRIDIIVPCTTPQVGASLLNGVDVQIFDCLQIGRLVTAQSKYETYPPIGSRIAPFARGAAVLVYLLRMISVAANLCQADSHGLTAHPVNPGTKTMLGFTSYLAETRLE